eukprot:10219388-Ditylum_brightwellii.AAC.1
MAQTIPTVPILSNKKDVIELKNKDKNISDPKISLTCLPLKLVLSRRPRQKLLKKAVKGEQKKEEKRFYKKKVEKVVSVTSFVSDDTKVLIAKANKSLDGKTISYPLKLFPRMI